VKRSKLFVVCLSVLGTIASAQTSQTLSRLLGDGIFVQGGVGYLALHDEFISTEKYSGPMSYFEVGWLKSRDSSAVRLSLEYRSAPAVKNNNVSAGVSQAELNLDYHYPVGTFEFLGRDVFALLGPSAEIYVYDRSQNIAKQASDIDNTQSYALFLSLGVNSTLVLPITSDFSAECSGRLNLIGVGGRSVNTQDQSTRAFKPVSIISGLRGSMNILLRYDVGDVLLLKAGYRFEICQSSSWDYLVSASDNLVVVITYRI
jgi:hypothetical protein